jgi:hypothetical protein
LRARLADNRDPRDLANGGRTLIELWPERVLAPGHYVLRAEATLPSRLLDFGGHPVWPYSVRSLEFDVEASTSGGQSNVFVESFTDTSMRSAAEVLDADGTALWSSSGKVEVRYPATAGDASAGEVSLHGNVIETDVAAGNLTVDKDAAAILTQTEGLVLLRAQRRMTIAGELARLRRDADEPVTTEAQVRDWTAAQFAEERDLSSWLARQLLAANDPARTNWTVLIAGGDLTITGRLRIFGPLMLVAGGRIRFSGSIECGHEAVIRVTSGGTKSLIFGTHDDGGVVIVPYRAPGTEMPERPSEVGDTAIVSQKFPLAIDAPLQNPFVRGDKAVFRVLSSPIPSYGNVGRWRTGALVHGYGGARPKSPRPGATGYVVRYLGQPSSSSSEILVDDPALLVDAKTLRLSIELDVYPSDSRWDPPWVDDVAVFWDAPGSEVGR